MARNRKSRPRVSHFEALDLAARWDGLAQLRDAGFARCGSSYPAAKRGLSISIAGMKMHAAGLRPLLEVAPTGFPSHSRLTATLEHLNAKYAILTTGTDAALQCSLAADRWRTMCKDVYRCVTGGIVCHDIQGLTSLIAPCSVGARSSSSVDVEPSFPSWSDVDDDASDIDIGDAKSDTDVELVGITCRCDKCQTVIELSSESDADGIRVPNPRHRGQKLETQTKTRRRLVRKTCVTQPAVAKPKKSKISAAQPALALDGVAKGAKVITRMGTSSRAGECYITISGKYLIGQTSKRSANYRQNIRQLAARINEGELTTKDEVTAALEAM